MPALFIASALCALVALTLRPLVTLIAARSGAPR